jgi:hypothetical protein
MYVATVTTLVTGILGTALRVTNRAYATITQTGEIPLYPATAIWFVMAGLIGFCLAFLTCESVNSYLLGPPPPVFSPEYVSAAGPMPRILKRAYVAAVIALCFIAILNVRKHAVLTNSAIVEQRALAFSTTQYRFSDISRITMSRFFIPASKSSRAHISASRSIFLWLRNGDRWSLKDSELFIANPESLAEYLATRCNLTVEYPETALDVPDPADVARRTRNLLLCIALVVLIAASVRAMKKFMASRSSLPNRHRD